MYASPVIYPLSQVPAPYKRFMALNPMVAVIEIFRAGFLGTRLPEGQYILTSVAVTAVLAFAGIVMFNRIEKNFMDVV